MNFLPCRINARIPMHVGAGRGRFLGGGHLISILNFHSSGINPEGMFYICDNLYQDGTVDLDIGNWILGVGNSAPFPIPHSPFPNQISSSTSWPFSIMNSGISSIRVWPCWVWRRLKLYFPGAHGAGPHCSFTHTSVPEESFGFRIQL